MASKNKTVRLTTAEMNANDRWDESPLPVEVIPNHMGINLSEVEAISWTKQPDGQIMQLTIEFKPKSRAVRK